MEYTQYVGRPASGPKRIDAAVLSGLFFLSQIFPPHPPHNKLYFPFFDTNTLPGRQKKLDLAQIQIFFDRPFPRRAPICRRQSKIKFQMNNLSVLRRSTLHASSSVSFCGRVDMSDAIQRPSSASLRSGGLSTSDKQVLLLGLCLKPETPATIEKLVALIEAEVTWDAGFVLCVAEDGSSPLHYAAKGNNYRICEYLVEHTNVRLSCKDHESRHPLHYAIRHYNMPLVQLLLQRSPARLVTHELLYGGDTLLHFATKIDVASRSPIVERLILLGADPTQPNANGVTAYAMANDKQSFSAFYMNNYMLNRTIDEDRKTVLPSDVDDDEVLCRQHRDGFVDASDGYAPSERRTVKYNKGWWTEGIEGVHQLTSFIQ